MNENTYVTKPTTAKTNFFFALSELATNPIATILMAFLVYFYTDVIGVNPAIVGTILMISRFLDGISDLVAGNIIDHTHSKAGKARPWYLRLAIPMALSYIILFTVPNCGTAGKVAYIFISYNLTASVVYTLFNAAMATFPTFLTKHRESRSIMSTARMFVACGTQLLLMMFGLRFVDMLGGGQSGWIKFAAILGAFAAVMMVIIYLNTKEESEGDEKAQENVPFRVAIKALFQNKYWFILLLAFFVTIVIQVCVLTDGVYYAKYVLKDLGMQANMSFYFLVPNLVVMLFLPGLFNKGVSKKKLCVLGAILTLVGSGVGFAFPASAGFAIGLAIRGAGFAFNMVCITAMTIETVVYGEWKTGYNIPGITLTATCVAQKLGSGIGAALLGAVLAAAGYNGLAETQPPSAVTAINYIYMLVPAILAIAWLIIYRFYKLDEEYPRYAQELAERHTMSGQENQK